MIMSEIVNSAPQNESSTHVSHQHSNFHNEFDVFDTHQFGYIRPHFAIHGVPADSHRHRPVVKSRSYTMKAPLMQDVYRKLNYFKVDIDAILPFNAEKITTNPTIGDDVSADVNTYLSDGVYSLTRAVQSVLSTVIGEFSGTVDSSVLTHLFKCLIFGELVLSRGSLLASLGCHLYNTWYAEISGGTPTIYDFDMFMDNICTSFIQQNTGSNNEIDVTIDGVDYVIDLIMSPDNTIVKSNHITFRDFLCMIRETSNWSFKSSEDSAFASLSFVEFNYNFNLVRSTTTPLNFARVAAYQLACAEFFTNDKVDYIYSAELYRQNMGDLLRQFIVVEFGDSAWPSNFVYNGVSYQYDYLSGFYLNLLLVNIASNPFNLIASNAIALAGLQYFINLFGLRRSLRYKDYFVGSRTSPLAVGDVNVNVNANLVNVVDITRKIQAQRFLNFVNHTGRTISNYLKGLFGVDLKQDRHIPQFLAEITEHVYTSEVENTGPAQLSSPQTVTAIFTSNSSNKEIEFGIDMYSTIIGVTSYDIERAYTNTIDRDFFIKDRFDMFVPQLQFVGDQPIYAQELSANDIRAFGTPFGYQYRDMQWKLFYSRASGGFVGRLPGYAFINKPMGYIGNNISPDFIRSFPTEFDNFFVSLTGYSLGNYFHFIVWTKNILDSSRPMIANPVILE